VDQIPIEFSEMDGAVPGPIIDTRGYLDRGVLAMLGKGLQHGFDEIHRQQLPAHLRSLLTGIC
jgi:hypothetical protein